MCRFAELEVRRGVAALVHGQAVAIFRTDDDQVYAVGNHDPYARTSVLARGIVFVRDDVPFVAPGAHGHASTSAPGAAWRTTRCRCPPTT